MGAACAPDTGAEKLGYEEYCRKYGAELDEVAGMSLDYTDMAEWFKAGWHGGGEGREGAGKG